MTAAPPSQPHHRTPPPAQPAGQPAHEAGEFTRMFRAAAMTAAPTPPPPPQAGLPQATARRRENSPACFMRRAQPGAIHLPLPRQRTDAGRIPSLCFRRGSDFTRLRISSAGADAAALKAQQAPEVGTAGSAHVYRNAFDGTEASARLRRNLPATAGRTPAPCVGPSAEKNQAGEFTRMFDSPLHPAPISRARRPRSVRRKRARATAQQQSAPVGRIYEHVRRQAILAATHRADGAADSPVAAGSRATNVFKTPQPPRAGDFGSPVAAAVNPSVQASSPA